MKTQSFVVLTEGLTQSSNVQQWCYRFVETHISFSKTLLPIGNKYSSSMSSRIVLFFFFFGFSESDSACGSTLTPCS